MSFDVNMIPDGKKNAVHLDVLAQLADLHPRAVKECIKEARRAGVPILSGDDGYWLGTQEEQTQFIDRMQRQALCRLKTISDMKKNVCRVRGGNNASVQSK